MQYIYKECIQNGKNLKENMKWNGKSQEGSEDGYIYIYYYERDGSINKDTYIIYLENQLIKIQTKI